MSASRFNSIFDRATSLAVLVAALAVVWSVLHGAGGDEFPSPITEMKGEETSPGDGGQHHDRAKLAIIEFSDFECPYCGRYARDTYPRLHEDFVKTGVIDYSFRHFPIENIHPNALKASEAAVCASRQGKLWELHGVLFKNQNRLDDLPALAGATDIELSPFRECLMEAPDTTIRADQAEARKFGINSTPTFLIGRPAANGKVKVLRRVAGAQTYSTFKSVIDGLLAGA